MTFQIVDATKNIKDMEKELEIVMENLLLNPEWPEPNDTESLFEFQNEKMSILISSISFWLLNIHDILITPTERDVKQGSWNKNRKVLLF